MTRPEGAQDLTVEEEEQWCTTRCVNPGWAHEQNIWSAILTIWASMAAFSLLVVARSHLTGDMLFKNMNFV